MSGFIVNKPQPQAFYNASKAAVHHLTKSLAAEWGERGVRVNAVAPTYIETPLTAFGMQREPEMYKTWLEMTPMERVGQPDEIASVVPVPGLRRREPADRLHRAGRRRLHLLVTAATAAAGVAADFVPRQVPMSDIGLVIFDCDGVLVDSEPLAMRVLLEGLAEVGYVIDEASAYERFLGRSLASMQAVLRDQLGFELSQDRLERMRLQLFELYRRELAADSRHRRDARPADDFPRCVASSSQMERLRLSLDVTGLLSRFVPHLFSATMVAQGKPAPDLFLHVAERMAVVPEACLVVEDSAAGIEAARRAGMSVFAFVGGSHARSAAYHAKLEALAPDLIFDDISRLPELLGNGVLRRRDRPIR